MHEYVALTFRTGIPAQDREHIRQRSALRRQGWETHLQAPWSQEGMPKRLAGGVCIMRRPKDEPGKWTEGEIKAVFAGWEETTIRSQELQKRNEALERLCDKYEEELCAPTDRVMELQERNEELQAVIDAQTEKIVVMSQPGPRADGGWLGPPRPDRNRMLQNKEETNG